jgi:outer membrane lipoprotein carrier protein
MFRWETVTPEASILVSNGKKVWFYTPPFREGENGQVMVRKAADVQSKLAIDLLSGQADLKKSFKTKKLSDQHFDLKPLIPAGDVARIELFLEKSTNLVYKVVLYTKTGNQTELVLKDVTVNPQLADNMFQFVPPENTEEIQ